VERAQTRDSVDEKERGFFLRDLYDGGKQFYSLAPADIDGGKLATAAWLSQLLAMAWATFDASPAAMTAPKEALDLGEALGAVILARIVVKRCRGDEVWSWAWRQGKVA
jgi:hypothetical protein